MYHLISPITCRTNNRLDVPEEKGEIRVKLNLRREGVDCWLGHIFSENLGLG